MSTSYSESDEEFPPSPAANTQRSVRSPSPARSSAGTDRLTPRKIDNLYQDGPAVKLVKKTVGKVFSTLSRSRTPSGSKTPPASLKGIAFTTPEPHRSKKSPSYSGKGKTSIIEIHNDSDNDADEDDENNGASENFTKGQSSGVKDDEEIDEYINMDGTDSSASEEIEVGENGFEILSDHESEILVYGPVSPYHLDSLGFICPPEISDSYSVNFWHERQEGNKTPEDHEPDRCYGPIGSEDYGGSTEDEDYKNHLADFIDVDDNYQDLRKPPIALEPTDELRRGIAKIKANGFTGRQARLLIQTYGIPPESPVKPATIELTDEQQSLLNLFNEVGFAGTYYPDDETMKTLKIQEDVDSLFAACGLTKFMKMSTATFPEAAEFLATLSLRFFDSNDDRYEKMMGGMFSFIVDGIRYRCSFRKLHKWFGFPDGQATPPDFDADELTAIWNIIAEPDKKFQAYKVKGTQIRNPALHYFRRAVGETMFSREPLSPVLPHEMNLICTALKTTVGSLPNGTKINGDRNNTSLAYLLLLHLQSIQTRTFPPSERKKALHVGGPISSILQLLRVPISAEGHHSPDSMNLEYLRKLRLIGAKGNKDLYVYKFPHPTMGLVKIPIPCNRFSSLKKTSNIAFLPPEELLLPAINTAPRRPQEETDIPVPQFREVPSAKPNKSRKASSRSPDSDESFDPLAAIPPPHDLKRLTSNMKEAHGRINVLAKVNRWLVKGWNGMTSRENDALKRERALAQRIQTLESRLQHAPPANQPLVERRRSISGDRRTAPHTDLTQAAPRRSAAAAEHVRHRSRRHRTSITKDPFDVTDDAAHLFED